MACSVQGGPRTWSLKRDQEGHREYTVVYLVKSGITDGPQDAMEASGLPMTGAIWGYGATIDPWAFCYPTAEVAIHQEKEGDPVRWWRVTKTFSTKPLKRCQDEKIEDPLLEPQKVSGSFVKYTKVGVVDRFGEPIENSSHELYTGSNNEWDHNRPTVKIEQNVASLELDLFAAMVDTVNDSPLWGLGARCIKLSNVSWERKYHGLCDVYYTRVFEFDIRYETFDRNLRDEGTMVLKGRWDTDDTSPTFGSYIVEQVGGAAPDVSNPQNFIRYKDRKGENCRVILNGAGLPADQSTMLAPGTVEAAGTASVGTTATGKAGQWDIEYYSEADFLLLGIPTSF